MTTPAEFYLAMKGKQTRDSKEWERTRFIAYNIAASVPRKKGSKLPSIKKWLPLPTDNTVDSLTEESHMKKVFEALNNRKNT